MLNDIIFRDKHQSQIIDVYANETSKSTVRLNVKANLKKEEEVPPLTIIQFILYILVFGVVMGVFAYLFDVDLAEWTYGW